MWRRNNFALLRFRGSSPDSHPSSAARPRSAVGRALTRKSDVLATYFHFSLR